MKFQVLFLQRSFLIIFLRIVSYHVFAASFEALKALIFLSLLSLNFLVIEIVNCRSKTYSLLLLDLFHLLAHMGLH